MHWRVFESQCNAPMPNFHERAEQRHFLRANLARAQERHALRPVLCHDGLELRDECLHRLVPIRRVELCTSRPAGAAAARWRDRARTSGVSASQPFGHAMPRFTG